MDQFLSIFSYRTKRTNRTYLTGAGCACCLGLSIGYSAEHNFCFTLDEELTFAQGASVVVGPSLTCGIVATPVRETRKRITEQQLYVLDR